LELRAAKHLRGLGLGAANRKFKEWKTEPDPLKSHMRLLRSRPDRVNKDSVQASLPKMRLSERAGAGKSFLFKSFLFRHFFFNLVRAKQSR